MVHLYSYLFLINRWMNKIYLESKLLEIKNSLTNEYCSVIDIGVHSGLSGVALFQFYYSKYLDKDIHAEDGVTIITSALERINEGYSYPTFCTGISGVGWVIDHLEEQKFLDIDADELLLGLDEYLHAQMVSEMKNKRYDFLHGAIGHAYYFVKRYQRTKSTALRDNYRKILVEFLDLLEKISEKEGEDKLKWRSETEVRVDEIKTVYNLSLSHGMSSIVGVLSKLHELDEFKEKSYSMLRKAINYIMSFMNEDKNASSLFPRTILLNGEFEGTGRLAWCYGDLGIALQFWHASKVLKDDMLGSTALEVFKHNAKRKTAENSGVIDAGVCHGSFGNAQIFGRMYKETRDIVFKEAADFWIQDGIDKAVHEDGYAGYKKWQGAEGKWYNEVSLLEGIAGIGLVIIDYLSDYDSNWDECLMIS